MDEIIRILHREFVYVWYYFTLQFRQIALYWVLGMVIGSLISVFAKDGIHGLFAGMQKKKWGVLGIIPACLLGIASPLCMYGTIPVAASFRKQGMRQDWLAAFMMASILLNPQLIIYSMALGNVALIIRIVSCFFCGIVAGLLVYVFYQDKEFFNFEGFSEKKSRDTHPNMLLRYLFNFGRNVKATGLYFLIGVLLSALFMRYVPEDLMVNIFAGNEAWGGSYGCNHRRTAICLRWWDNPAIAELADGRDESRVGGSIYDNRTCHKDNQSGGTEDRDGVKEVLSLYFHGDGIFFCGRITYKCFCLKNEN